MEIKNISTTLLQENKTNISELQDKIKKLVEQIMENDQEVKSIQLQILKTKRQASKENKSYGQNLDKLQRLIKEHASKFKKESEIVQKLSDIRTRCQKYTTDINILKEVLEKEKSEYENEMNTCQAQIKKLSIELENHVVKLRSASNYAVDENTKSIDTFTLYEDAIKNLDTKLADVDVRLQEELQTKVKHTSNLSALKEQTNKLNLELQQVEEEYKKCKVTAEMELSNIQNKISVLGENVQDWKLQKSKFEEECYVARKEQEADEEEIRRLRTSLQNLKNEVFEKQERNIKVSLKLLQREKELNALRKEQQSKLSVSGNDEWKQLQRETSALCDDVNTTKLRLQAVRDTIGAERERASIATEKRQKSSRKECQFMDCVKETEAAEQEQRSTLNAKSNRNTTNNVQVLETNNVFNERGQLERNNEHIYKMNEMSKSDQKAAQILDVEKRLHILQRQYNLAIGLNQELRQALTTKKEELNNLEEIKKIMPKEVKCLTKHDQLQDEMMMLLQRKMGETKQDQTENVEKQETNLTNNQKDLRQSESSFRDRWNLFTSIFQNIESVWTKGNQ